MDDITALILDDHYRFRVGFARLDDAQSPQELAAIWTPLALHLDIHADAEEEILYPHLLKDAGGDDAVEETDDAIRDHNKIRHGIEEAGRHPVGSDAWWKGVWQARTENSEHLAEEEDEVLPDFRKHASRELRLELGARWLRFFGSTRGARGCRSPTRTRPRTSRRTVRRRIAAGRGRGPWWPRPRGSSARRRWSGR